MPRWCVCENVAGILSIAADDVCKDLEREGYDVGILNFEAAAVGAPHRRERVFFVANARHGGRERQEDAFEQQRGADVIWTSEAITDAEHDGSPASAVSRVDSKNASGSEERAERAVEPAGTGGHGCDGDVADAYDTRLQRRDGAIVRECTGERVAGEGDPSFSDTAGTIRDRSIEHRDETRIAGLANADWRPIIGSLGDETDGISGQMAGRMNWWDWDWDSIPRVTQGEKNRADKLKALGNAVVPAQAAPIFLAIAEIERGWQV